MLEGLAPLQTRPLRTHVSQLDEISHWFCEQRHLADRPGGPSSPECLNRSARSVAPLPAAPRPEPPSGCRRRAAIRRAVRGPVTLLFNQSYSEILKNSE